MSASVFFLGVLVGMFLVGAAIRLYDWERRSAIESRVRRQWANHIEEILNDRQRWETAFYQMERERDAFKIRAAEGTTIVMLSPEPFPVEAR